MVTIRTAMRVMMLITQTGAQIAWMITSSSPQLQPIRRWAEWWRFLRTYGRSDKCGNWSKKMKTSINRKIYNTDTMDTLCSKDAYNNGNFCGSTSIRKTKTGLYAVVVTSNGQDLYRSAYINAIDKDQIAEFIDGWPLDDDETQTLLAEGILTEA